MSTSHEHPATLDIRLLAAAAAADDLFVDRLAALVNDVYAAAEDGLWRGGWKRTTVAGLTELIRAGQLAVATRQGRIAGCVRVHDLSDEVGELGLLVSAPDQRGIGVGRALVAFAEAHCGERGLRAIQLELLVPRERPHANKEFLRAWYGRIGYRLIGTADVGRSYPQLVPLLLTPCDIETYEKALPLEAS